MSIDIPMAEPMLALVDILYNSSNGNLTSGNSTYANSTHGNSTSANSTSANSTEMSTTETYTKPSVTQNILIQFIHPEDVDKTDEGTILEVPPSIENSVTVLASSFMIIFCVYCINL